MSIFNSHPPLFSTQAKENLRVKDAFDTLVRKIVSKSPKAGQDADGAGGVFGGGKADSAMDEPEPVKMKKSKSRSASSAEKKSPLKKEKSGSKSKGSSVPAEKEKEGKCILL